jgi:hypothetical protein
MTCYYPLIGLPRGIVSHLSYSTLTHNQRTSGSLRPRDHSLDLAIYAPRREGWQCLDRFELPPAGDLSIRSSDYQLGLGELLVAVPLRRGAAPDPADLRLPLPCSKKVDRSPVAERCSLAFTWRGVTSSYQGEYPVRMAQLERGTLLSFDALLQTGANVGLNLLCLVNLDRGCRSDEHNLEVFVASSRRRLHSIPYRSNSCCVVEISPDEVAGGEIFMRSTTSLGIPIFITLSREDLPASMSVEHTHPPTELFSERDRMRGSRMIKSSWLGMPLQ